MADRLLYDIKGDIQLIAGAKHPLPWVIGGCINETNVVNAITVAKAGMIDASFASKATAVERVRKIVSLLDAAGATSR